VSVAVRDQVLRAADRTVAKQAPPYIFVRAAFPVVEHLHHVWRELDGHQLFPSCNLRSAGRNGRRRLISYQSCYRGWTQRQFTGDKPDGSPATCSTSPQPDQSMIALLAAFVISWAGGDAVARLLDRGGDPLRTGDRERLLARLAGVG
jgi:hypothetical protein